MSAAITEPFEKKKCSLLRSVERTEGVVPTISIAANTCFRAPSILSNFFFCGHDNKTRQRAFAKQDRHFKTNLSQIVLSCSVCSRTGSIKSDKRNQILQDSLLCQNHLLQLR